MQAANVSLWANLWYKVHDFTPGRGAINGDPNWFVNPKLNWKLMAPLGEVQEKVSKVKEFKSKVKSVKDISDSDLELIRLEFDEEAEI